MWDFETYWYAANSVLHGGSPYSSDQLAQVADRPVEMPFVYPPATIPIFFPFTFLPVHVARWLWLGANVLAFLALFQIWRRQFLQFVPLVPLCFAAAFGFNGAVIWDLKTGNVAGIEHLILWLGFVAYAYGQRAQFAVRVVAASIFKLLPAAFLGLLAVPSRGRRAEWKTPVLSLTALAVFVLVPVAIGPQWVRGYLGNFPDERPWGYVNPSALGLIDTLLGRHGGDLLSGSLVNLLLWVAYALLVAFISIHPLKRAWGARDPILWVMTATPLFVLLTPRPMIYGYLLAIPAMFYLVSPLLRNVGGHYTTAAILSAQAFVIPGLGLNYENPWTSNLPLFLLLGLWAFYASRATAPVAEASPGEGLCGAGQAKAEVPLSKPVPRPWPLFAIVIAAMAGTAWFLFAEFKVAGRLGFSLDYSWIYATFARNLATGQGYTFNPGEMTGGATGPLYVGILAGLYLLFRDVVVPAKTLGALCLLASSILVYHSVQRIDPRDQVKPLVAGLLTALSPSLLWGSLSGMEIPVYMLLACLGLHAYVSQRWIPAVLYWSLGVWVWPDGLFLVLVGLIARPKVSSKRIIPIAVASCIVGAFFAFNQIVGGHPLPTSVGVTAHPWTNVPSIVLGAVRLWGTLFGPNMVGEFTILLLPAIVVGAVLSMRRLPALSIYVLGAPLAFAIAGIPWSADGRSILYIVPFGAVLGVFGLDFLARRALGRRWATGFIAAGLICIAWQVYQARVKGIIHGWNVQNIESMHRFFAERVATVASPGDTIAVNDVGAMGYFSKCYIVDLVGRMSPPRTLPENLAHYHPKYLAIFPELYASYGVRDPQVDNIVFYAPDSTYKYTPVAGVGLTRNTIAPGDQMILFQRIGPHETGPVEVPVVWR